MGLLRFLVALYLLVYIVLYFGLVGGLLYVRSILETNYNEKLEALGYIISADECR